MPLNVFRKSFKGYNRRDVDEYIAEMNRTFVKQRRDYEKKIEILEAENTLLRRRHEEAQEAPPQREISQVAAVSDVEATEKSRRYDEISRQVGEILMNANAEASVIVREADDKVRSTLNGTMSTLRGELTSMIAKLNELLKSAEETLAADDGAEDGEGD